MCYHNYSQHNGCGHIGESHEHPWTLCDRAIQRLNNLRGPGSPPVSPPATAPPKRTSSTRRFFSLSGQLSRSNTSASTSSRRSGASAPRTSVSSSGSYTYTVELDYSTLPDHQLAAVRCADPTRRTYVSRGMVVCKECARWIEAMRSMIQFYDKKGSVRGTAAFEKFLKWEGEGGGEREGDLTVPLDDGDDGAVYGARQAIILGHPESAMNAEGPRGLGTLEREMESRYRY
ncbi:hypothetical protein COCVIDRAFT_83925 [Bipolaris victoriae FI3]|uniref:Uncharacterized protein n=2 Tax=Bipolaris TaxID=33194 RepID=W6Y8H6_COCC2|nr:uncharacterized protein COCCADRAFT_36429 [Bipolaris zeicola 26-R-13]XP_014562706.1 hypothetical protein COCVIDRAFT_83925 [Bipolaris victoriae FI3]EUC33770.1 hypothetical protein COCCADRAFT_36429 [Bipolaris zeicola 26-R-13]